MEVRKDIRMEVVSVESAMQYINDLPGKWIYIKHINATCIGDETEQITTYTKFKVRNVDTLFESILIYGEEDYDRLIMGKQSIVSYQMTPNKDELFIQVNTGNNNTDIYIRNYLPNIRKRLNEILESKKNLIITEGKTDWKHLKSALLYFQNEGLYRDIQFTFFEYEDEIDMGADTLLKVLEYNQLFYSDGVKIFIFDADKEDINKKHQGKKYIDWGNNIYSFIIPIPELRRDTPLISIENYYIDEDIKIEDSCGRRLYINEEFDPITGVLISNPRIYDIQHGKNKKMPANHIIDDGVFFVPETIPIGNENILKIKKECSNIALPKNHFANYIMNLDVMYQKVNFENFKLIFDIIREIQNCPLKVMPIKKDSGTGEIQVGAGIYIKNFCNGLKTLEVYVEETEKTAELGKNSFFYVNVKVKENNLNIILYNETKKIIEIPLPLNAHIIEFMEDKIDNEYNRVEIHFVKNEMERIMEVLKGDMCGVLIERALFPRM